MSVLENIFKTQSLERKFLADYDKYFVQFLEAIHKNDESSIDQFLSRSEVSWRNKNHRTKETLLHLAVRFGSIKLVNRIVELGTNINAQDNKGETPLHRAITRSTDFVQVLLDNGANVAISDKTDLDSLQRSLLFGSLETVCLLMQKKYSRELCSNQEKSLRNDYENCSKIVKNCLALDNDLNWETYPILVHFAAKYGDEETLRLALKESKYMDINSLNPEGQGLLHVLTEAGRLDSLKIILDYGADVDQTDSKECTALYYALLQNDLTIVSLLLHYRADVNFKNAVNITPLSYFPEYCTTDILKILVKTGTYIHEVYQSPKTYLPSPLHNACGLIRSLDHLPVKLIENSWETKHSRNEYWSGCSLQIIKFLLKKGANVNAQSLDGMTPLLVACRSGRMDIVKTLIDFGADFHDGSLHQAVQGNNLNLISFLVEKGAKINTPTSDGMTPLLTACSLGHLKVVELLLEYGADLHERALLYAVQGRKLDLVSFLVAKGANVNLPFSDGITPLLIACKTGQLETVQILLKFGARLHEEALLYAVDGRNVDLVSFLIEKGANVNTPFSDGITPLLIACKAGRLDLAQVLLKFGADLHEEALLYAVDGRNVDLVSFLLEKGAKVNTPTSDGLTPFLVACSAGRLNLVQLLLEYGADLHERALIYAVLGNHIGLVSFLVDKGANVNAKASNGVTPLLIACNLGRLDIVQILLKFGSRLHEGALLHAVAGRNLELISFLIGKGLSVNTYFTKSYHKSKMEEVTTPFHSIFDAFHEHSDVELIEMLADNGANVKGAYPGGYNIVMKAIHNQKPEEVACLLELEACIGSPLGSRVISPYSGLCLSRAINRENPGESLSLQQFTAFLALEEIDISFYANMNELNDQSQLQILQILNDFDDSIYQYHEKLFQECKLEIEKLKSTKIYCQKAVSCFDFLTKELHDVMAFARREKFMQELNSLDLNRDFPCYAFLLKQRIKRVKRLIAHVNLIEEFLKEKNAKRQLPWIVLEKIFSFWSVADVRNFGRALSM